MIFKFISKGFILSLILASASSFNPVLAQSNDNYTKGIQFYSDSKFLMAIGSFKKAIDEGYKDPKVYFLLGNAYANNEDYDRAIDEYNTALSLTGDAVFQSIITHNTGYVFFLKKDYKSSIEYLAKAYQMNTNLVQAFWFKGMAYYRLKDKTNTINEWEGYLDRAPQGPQSDNIRKALAILKSGTFDFDKDKIFPPENQAGTSNKAPNVESLVNIEGVLDQIKPVDKGKAPDTQVEEIEK